MVLMIFFSLLQICVVAGFCGVHAFCFSFFRSGLWKMNSICLWVLILSLQISYNEFDLFLGFDLLSFLILVLAPQIGSIRVSIIPLAATTVASAKCVPFKSFRFLS